MQSKSGLFIVLEGSDGSGKATQFEALHKRLTQAGHEVEVFDFPRYAEPSSYFIIKYLNGQYGPASTVNPYTASLFYALDRYEAAPLIREALQAGKIVLSNRYVGSNMAHQGTKFHDEVEKRSFFIWEDSIEFQLLNIPRPTINLFLRVPAEISYELVAKKAARNYTSSVHDEHEADINHLTKAVEIYDLLCSLFPRDFWPIDCVEEGRLLSIEQVSQRVWDSLQPLLPSIKVKVPEPTPRLDSSSVQNKPLTKVVSSVASEFLWQLPGISYLAAIEIMMRLPALELKEISWCGGLSDYSFYTPEALSVELKNKYNLALSSIAKQHKTLHSDLARSLGSSTSMSRVQASTEATKILKDATPAVAIVSGKLLVTKAEAYEMYIKLSLIQNEEVQKLAADFAYRIRKLWTDIDQEVSEALQQQSLPEAIGSIIEKLTREIVPRRERSQNTFIKLLESHPRNEFDLIADGLSNYSSISKDDILNQMSGWNYQQKSEALKAALSKDPSTLDRASYRLEFSQTWQVFKNWLSTVVGKDLQRQLAKPLDGYKVPQAVEEAILEDAYQYIFSQSSELYTAMQTEHDGRTLEYATLLGHRLRWQMDITAADIAKMFRLKLKTVDVLPLVDIIGSVNPTVASYINKTNPRQNESVRPSKSKRRRRASKKK